MPELPEVETIVRSLRNPSEWQWEEPQAMNARPGVVGRVVRSARVLWPRTVATPTVEEFCQRIAGQEIMAVERRGKFIVFSLNRDTLLIHLRMSGDLRVEPATCADQLHDRLVIEFVDGMKLAFNDTRKFGRTWLVSDPASVTEDLGPEPFEEGFTGEDLYERVHTSRRSIKTLLLDQSVLAGVGNIYSDEALFRAQIHPATPACEITPLQAGAVLAAIREVMEEGIRRNGASIDWVYRGGDFQNYFRVYQRTGEPCLVCGTPIQRVVIGQRSSHFCPHCQSK